MIRHLRMPVLAMLMLAAQGATSPRLAAQSEHVPAVHPVHDFLDRMHVRGLLPAYSRASLPLVRETVVSLLRGIDSIRNIPEKQILFSETERALLARYVDEFVREEDGTQQPVVILTGEGQADGFGSALLSDREKFFYRWMNPDRSTTFFMELLGSAELRALPGADGAPRVVLGQVGGRFRGTIGSSFGYGLQATNGTTFGSRDLALADRIIRQNANFSDFGNDYFDITEAYVSARWSWGDASLGKETILLGTSPVNRVLIGNIAPTFDALRLNAHAGHFRFSFLHGFLLGDKSMVESNFRPFYHNKFIAAHRAEVDIADMLRFGVFETVIYSRRDLDPAYLNPVNFYKSAEHAGGDRDNPMLGFDLATLCFGGHEFYGTWSIDDVDFSRMGSGWWGNKFVWQGGVISHALAPDMEVGLEYTRIEPYVFSHTLLDNEYTHKGYALALEIQPNSDEWLVRVRRWFGSTLLTGLTVQYRRHGMNEWNDTVLVKNNGGDINTRFVRGRDSENAPFLSGPLETQLITTATLRYEIVRNCVLDAVYRYRRFGGVRAREDDHFLSLLLELQI